MAETALSLLNNQVQTAAQVFGQINQTLDASANASERTAQFTLATAGKIFQMQETARMHDAQLADMQFRNELSAKQHEARMQLMPLQIQNERLGLEIRKQEAARALQQNQLQQFNNVVAPFNARVGSSFAKNQNPDYAKDYLNIQAKWRGHIANGGRFDANAYARDVDALDRAYQGSTPKGEYNPEVSYLLGELGATSEKARYEAKNPVFKSNLLAIKSSAITGGPEAYAKLLTNPQISSMLTDDEHRSLGMASQAYQNLSDQIESKEAEVKRFNAGFASMADNNPAKQGFGASLEASMKELTSLRQQRDNILAQAIDGKPLTVADEANQQDDIAELVRRNLSESRERQRLLPKPAGQEEDEEIINKQAYGLPEVQNAYPEATRGINFAVLRDVDLEATSRFGGSDNLNILSRQIRHNLDQVDDIGALFSGEKNKAKFRDLFERYKNRGSRTFTLPQSKSYNQPGLDYGVSVGEDRRFETFEDLENWMNNFEGTDAQRHLFLEDVYTSLVLADIFERSRPDSRLPLAD